METILRRKIECLSFFFVLFSVLLTVFIAGTHCLVHQKTSVWTTFYRISWSYECC
jgi:hypothetical protein